MLRIAKLVVAAILATVIITDQRAWAQNESEPEVVFSYAQARVVALRALQRGNFELAGAMSSVLLVNDPNDAEALLVRALLLRATGQLDVASDAAARAYRNSDNPGLRFDVRGGRAEPVNAFAGRAGGAGAAHGTGDEGGHRFGRLRQRPMPRLAERTL